MQVWLQESEQTQQQKHAQRVDSPQQEQQYAWMFDSAVTCSVMMAQRQQAACADTDHADSDCVYVRQQCRATRHSRLS
jgi:hypothetical protein